MFLLFFWELGGFNSLGGLEGLQFKTYMWQAVFRLIPIILERKYSSTRNVFLSAGIYVVE